MTSLKPPHTLYLRWEDYEGHPFVWGQTTWSDAQENETDAEYTGGPVHSWRHVGVSGCGLEFSAVFRTSLDGASVTCPVCLDRIKERRGRKTEPLKPLDGAGY